jgi:hypothetical protein
VSCATVPFSRVATSALPRAFGWLIHAAPMYHCSTSTNVRPRAGTVMCHQPGWGGKANKLPSRLPEGLWCNSRGCPLPRSNCTPGNNPLRGRLAHGEPSHAIRDPHPVREYFLCAHRRTSFRDPAALIMFRNAGLRSPCANLPLPPRFFVTREDFVPRASRPCSSMAGMAMAQLWLRLCRTILPA